MKTQHLLIAAGAIALLAYLATRPTRSSNSAIAGATARNAAVAARYRQQIWSEVEPDFYA